MTSKPTPRPADHDQRFKNLLKEFFFEFFQLFFPRWAERFDFARIEWLDKEVFTDPPQGQRRFLDVIAKLATRQPVPAQRPGEAESWIALVHVEVEGADTVAPLRSRMYEYYEQLRRQHLLPVLPIGLYLGVGLDGLGSDVYEEYFWEFRPLRFEYLYVGLPGLAAEDYLTRDNWLGVALTALMRIPEERKIELAAEALKRLTACPENDYRRFLLCECVQAYLPLNEPQRQQLDQVLQSDPYKGVLRMATTWYEQGEIKGQRQTLQTLLEEKFGSLSLAARQRLESWPSERLAELCQALLKAQSLQELGLDE